MAAVAKVIYHKMVLGVPICKRQTPTVNEMQCMIARGMQRSLHGWLWVKGAGFTCQEAGRNLAPAHVTD